MKSIVIALILTASTLAQDKPDPAQAAIDTFSERVAGLLARTSASDYQVDKDGALIINGQRWIVPFTNIPKDRVKGFIKHNGCWSCGSRKGK